MKSFKFILIGVIIALAGVLGVYMYFDIPAKLKAYENTQHYLDGGNLKCAVGDVNSSSGIYWLASFNGGIDYMADNSIVVDGVLNRSSAGNSIFECEIVK